MFPKQPPADAKLRRIDFARSSPNWLAGRNRKPAATDLARFVLHLMPERLGNRDSGR